MRLMQAIKEAQVSVIIVADEPLRARQMKDALGLINFKEIAIADNFGDLGAQIEQHPMCWVITTFTDPKGYPLSDYLSSKVAKERLSPDSVAFSIFLRANEYEHLPDLFQAGIMSWHEMTASPGMIRKEIAQSVFQLQKVLESSMQPYHVPLHYCRQYFKMGHNWSDMIGVLERLLSLRPKDDILRLTQIEAYMQSGDLPQAKVLIGDFDYYDPILTPQVAALRHSLLGEDPADAAKVSERSAISSALIVDPLMDSSIVIEGKLRELGIKDVVLYADGKEAVFALGQRSFDLAIVEWQTPMVSGAQILQKLREKCSPHMPILILTQTLERSDIQLLKDMGVAHVLKRPINPQQVLLAAAWAIDQARAPSEAISIERSVLAFLKEGELEAARQMFAKYMTIETRDPVREKYLRAALLFADKRYFEAKLLLIECTHASRGDNVAIASLLGKCLIKLGEMHAARLLLEKIAQLSPKNVERLCDIAEVALQQKDHAGAQKQIERAMDLDPDSSRVQDAHAQVALAGPLSDKVASLIKAMPGSESIIAHINNLAVTFVRSGDVSEGMRLYENCRKCLRSEQTEYKAIVAYNMGLAQIKLKNFKDAQNFVQESAGAGKSSVEEKAKALNLQLEAINSGKKKARMSSEHQDLSEQKGGEVALKETPDNPEDIYFLRGFFRSQDSQKAS